MLKKKSTLNSTEKLVMPLHTWILILEFNGGAAIYVLEISDVRLQAGCVVKLTYLALLPEIEGVASRLRPARLTTPNDSLGRQVLDVMVEQTPRCKETVIVSRQAVHGKRDAHFTSSEKGSGTTVIVPITAVR